jgi:hypothetical protein
MHDSSERVQEFVVSHVTQTMRGVMYSVVLPYIPHTHKVLGDARVVLGIFCSEFRWSITHHMRHIARSVGDRLPSPIVMHSFGLWVTSNASVESGVPDDYPSPMFGTAVFASSLAPIDPWVIGLDILLDFIVECELDPSHIHTLDGAQGVAHLDRGQPNLEVVRPANSFSGWDARTYGFGVPFPQEPPCALGVTHPHHFDRAGNCRCPPCATKHQPLLRNWVRL